MRAFAFHASLLTLLAVVPRAAAVPEVNWLYPAGGQRGHVVELTLGGKFPEWPVGIWTSDPSVAVKPLEAKGKLEVAIAADAEPGLVWIRVYDKSGAAQPRPWVVGTAPEVNEQEANDTAATAQALAEIAASTRTIVVNGRLEKAGDVDVFSIPARLGQTLVADLDAQAVLKSPFDGVLQILTPEGFVADHNDDQHRLDPRLASPVTSDGTWMVRVFGFPETPTNQVRLAGSQSYVYRLTLSTGPVVNYAMPMAVRIGHPSPCRLVGWNIPAGLSEISLVPPDNATTMLLSDDRIDVTIRVPAVACPTRVESEPNAVDQPTPIELPVSVTGRIDAAGDRDVFRVEAVPGKTLLVDVESRQLGFPLDPVLELIDADGKQLARDDDGRGDRDAKISHAVAAEGPLRIVVSDLHRAGGPDFIYRLNVAEASPSYRLVADAHQVVVKAGETAELPITVERIHGHDGTINVRAVDLPEGVTVAPVTSKHGEDSAGKVTIAVAAAADVAAASFPIRLLGEVEASGTRAATFAVPGHPSGLADVWLTVLPK